MRKVFTTLAGGALAIMLFAPAAHAASFPQLAHHHSHHGIVGALLGIVGALLDWLL
jgi:hypothetical protein